MAEHIDRDALLERLKRDAAYPYVIVNAAGVIVCQAPAACRYPKCI